MVRILVDYGTNVDTQNGEGQTSLHIAAAEGDEALVKYFYGVRASASIADNMDRTPMHLAAENGHAHIIEILADKFKASIYERTKDGSTLMHIASLNGHAECATMLFKKGVYLHMPNKRGARSIHTAARYGHIGIINTLIQRGEKVDITTNVSLIIDCGHSVSRISSFTYFFRTITQPYILRLNLPNLQWWRLF